MSPPPSNAPPPSPTPSSLQDERDGPESTINPAVNALRREVARGAPGLDDMLIEAAAGAPTKTPHLALVVGLLRLQEREWADALARRAAAEAEAALAAGGGGRDRARLLVRFLGCLVAPGVVSGASAARMLRVLLEAAMAAAVEGGSADPSGATWQPYSDFLAYCALAALPWCGGDLAGSAPDELQGVLDVAEAYMEVRPIQFDALLAPFTPGALPEGDPGAAADSGGASFLGELWRALQECATGGWRVESIPQDLLAPFAQRLARGDIDADGAGEGAPPPLELEPLTAAPTPPAAAAAAGARLPPAALRAEYPPRGGLVLLPRDKVEGGRPPIERLVLEEYVLDSVTVYDGRRVELARILVSRLPVRYDHVGALVETLLGALVRLPAPALRPVAYATLLMDVCKLARESPKYLAAWVRAAHERAAALDPELRERIAEYLAHHLSNFQWLWGWERWADALAAPEGDARRALCGAALRRMLALSYWEHLRDGWAQAVDPQTREARRIKKFLPEGFEALLGPKPVIPPLPGTEPAQQPRRQQQQQQQQGGDGDAEMEEQQQQQQQEGEGAAAAAAAGEGQQHEEEQEEEQQEPVTPELEWAARLLSVLRARKPPAAPGAPGAPHSSADVLAWLRDSGLRAELPGGAAAALRAVARAVLAAGAKTPTHLNVMVERYGELLRTLVEEADAEAAAADAGAADELAAGGGSAGADALLGALAAAYGRHASRLALAADRLQGAGVVSAAAVASWALRWDWLQLGPPRDAARAAAAMTVLRGALAGALAAEGAADEEAARQGAAVRDAEAQLAAAADELARVRERDAEAAAAAGGGEARSSARADFAARAEAAAAARLDDARAELARLEAKVAAAAPALRRALLALFRGLAARLGSGDGTGDFFGGGGSDADMGDGGDDGDPAAARREALAQARALARWLALPSQAVAGEVGELLAAGAVAEDLREAVLPQLGLPL